MDPNVVVGERRVRDRSADGRHVAADAIARGIDRAAGCGRRAVALEALRLVEGVRGLDVAVGIMAGHAVELVPIHGVAATPGKGRRLEPNRAWVGGGNRAPLGAVALSAQPDDRFARGQVGPGNCRLGETCRDGLDVIPTRTVAPLAADTTVAA